MKKKKNSKILLNNYNKLNLNQMKIKISFLEQLNKLQAMKKILDKLLGKMKDYYNKYKFYKIIKKN